MCLVDDGGSSSPFSVSGFAADVNNVNFSNEGGTPFCQTWYKHIMRDCFSPID